MVIISNVRWLLDCPFGQVWDCIVKLDTILYVVCILTNILVIPSFVLWATTTYVDLENTGEVLPKFSLNTHNTYISPTIQCNSERDKTHHPKS